ncbi:hypothetical protein A2W24_02980 [Microgenomates group bacterium RBG_16_45_19]|nr:MAG: hypothetical protein A2W24_02980 [Microgenomates group bacterium RBG_16_45_19]
MKPVNQVLETDWYQGNKAAAVVIVEYSDFQCPACRLYSPLIEQLTQLYPDQLAVVYRHFPLKEIHPRANLAAQAAEAAGKQGKFWEMNHLLFERQEEWAESGQASKIMMGYAQELGLNSDQFKQDLNSKAVKGLVKADYLSALANRLNGTPSFFVNGSRIENPQGLAAFQAVLEPLLPATDSATISE